MEYTVLLIVEVLSALGLIGLVLLQQGKGADVGASFGAGASQTIFGSSGSGNFMTRMTGLFAAIFFATSLGLAYVSGKEGRGEALDFSGLAEPESAQLELPMVGGAEDDDVSASSGDAQPEELDGDLPAIASPSSAESVESSELPVLPAPVDEETAPPPQDDGASEEVKEPQASDESADPGASASASAAGSVSVDAEAAEAEVADGVEQVVDDAQSASGEAVQQ